MPDHCTWWPDWIGGVYLGGCCLEHDNAYDAGGSVADFLASNAALGACVARLDGNPVLTASVGLIMVAGTTIAGWFWWRRSQSRKQ